MDNGFIVVIGLIVLLILGTGILFIVRSKEGSFGWDIKTRLFQASSRVEGASRADIEQVQQGGNENVQIASKDAKSRQDQRDGQKNQQRIQ